MSDQLPGTEVRVPAELRLPAGPTTPQASPTVLEGFVGPVTPHVPTPGVSLAATRVPTAPTLPDDPTNFTGILARLATELFGVSGAGIGGAPEFGGAGAVAPGSGVESSQLRPASSLPSSPAPAQAVAPPTGPVASPNLPSSSAVSGAAPRSLDLPSGAAAAPPAPGLSAAPPAPSSPRVPASAPGVAAAPPAPGLSAAPSAPSPSRVPASPSVVAPASPAMPAGTEGLRLDALFGGLEDPFAPLFTLPLTDHDPAPPAAPARPAHEGSIPTSSTSAFAPPPALALSGGSGFDADALREEFPILRERVHGKRLVWLDNAATTQKPQAVIDRVVHYYAHENSNIHRAAHALAARATDAYEGARESVRRFLNARSVREVIFVRGATEGINLVAQSWGRRNVGAGDEIVLTHLEHHANIVPWQMLAKEKDARLRVAPVDDHGQILLDEYEKLIGPRTRLVALPQVSNALGTVTPAREMIEIAHRHGAKVLLDGAQSVSHLRVDLQALNPDFFVFSGHKVFAPTGVGAVVGRESVLEDMPPWQGGGNMIQDVTFERTVFHPPPMRFEAGTGTIADAVGLGTALDWLTRVGLENVERHEHTLLEYGTARLCEIPGLTIIGTAPEKAGVLSFTLEGHETQAISSYLDKEGIAVRGGHHCAQPILRRFGLESTVRASLAPYNTTGDLDALADALWRLVDGAAR